METHPNAKNRRGKNNFEMQKAKNNVQCCQLWQFRKSTNKPYPFLAIFTNKNLPDIVLISTNQELVTLASSATNSCGLCK